MSYLTYPLDFSHTIYVTEEILSKLTNHVIELRIWDTRDKLSAKARFDRPKAFRLPQAKPGTFMNMSLKLKD